MVYVWNEEWQVFCDEMGLPLPKSALRELREQLDVAKHMSPKELASIAKEIAHQRFPSMADRMDFSTEAYK